MRQSSDNPDILITVTKSADKSIDYTYVPESVQYIQTDAFSKPVYNYSGQYKGHRTTNNYERVTSGGYTVKNAATSAYLEVDMLLRARMNESTPPLAYQLKYSYNSNSDTDVDALYRKVIATNVHHPFDNYLWRAKDTCWESYSRSDDSIELPSTRRLLLSLGVWLDGDMRVVAVIDGPFVKETGLKKGDVIKDLSITKVLHGQSSSLNIRGTVYYLRRGQKQEASFNEIRGVNVQNDVVFSTF